MAVRGRRTSPTGEDAADMTGTVLQEFYSGATVFVTGGAGFMGKVLVEKLLRSCPKISHVYLLIREKKGRSAQERVDDVTSSTCFSDLLRHHPEFRSKMSAVAGDVSQDSLGLSPSDRRLLSDQVNIVFHLAATVRFDEQLKVALTHNVRSTREVMKLCCAFTNLKSAVYVSTAFSNCTVDRIEERLYDPPMPSQDAMELVDRADNDDLLVTMTSGLLKKWPNTYNFSKAIAEDAVKCYGQGLPVGVFRPSIVVCSVEEPLPGWTDSMFGPMGMSLGMAAGVVRVMWMDPHEVSNIVPCDMAINCLIATAWDVAENKTSTEIPVYNCVVPKENSHSFRDGYNYLFKYATQLPVTHASWYMGVSFTSNRVLVHIYYALLHLLPAMLADIYLVLTSKRAKTVHMMKKIHKVQAAYSFFNTRAWLFDVDNVQRMWNRLNLDDQNMFNFDFMSLDWNEFYRNAWFGIRKYLAMDSVETIPAAKARMRRLYWLHRATQCAFACLIAYLSWNILS